MYVRSCRAERLAPILALWYAVCTLKSQELTVVSGVPPPHLSPLAFRALGPGLPLKPLKASLAVCSLV